MTDQPNPYPPTPEMHRMVRRIQTVSKIASRLNIPTNEIVYVRQARKVVLARALGMLGEPVSEKLLSSTIIRNAYDEGREITRHHLTYLRLSSTIALLETVCDNLSADEILVSTPATKRITRQTATNIKNRLELIALG